MRVVWIREVGLRYSRQSRTGDVVVLTCPTCQQRVPEGTECQCMVVRARARLVEEKAVLQERVRVLEWRLIRFAEVLKGFRSFHDLLARGLVQPHPSARVPRRLSPDEPLVAGDFNDQGRVLEEDGGVVGATNVQNWHRWEG